MIKTLFVTATGTDIGKTYATLKIMQLLAAKGLRAVAFKPIETGVQNVPVDASKLLQKYKELYRDDALAIDDICPYRFALPAAPYVSADGLDIDVSLIGQKLEMLKAKADVVLMEGAGGLFVPIKANYFMIDLAKELSDFTILISHTGLGCINDAILSHKALQGMDIPHIVVFNRRDDDNFDVVSKPFLKDYFKAVIELDNLAEVLPL